MGHLARKGFSQVAKKNLENTNYDYLPENRFREEYPWKSAQEEPHKRINEMWQNQILLPK